MRARSMLVLAATGGALALAAPRLARPSPEAWMQAQVEGWATGAPPAGVLEMRRLNPEWDFMARTFLVLALADRALEAAPAERERLLAAMDAAIADTLAAVQTHGQRWYLLGYADAAAWRGSGRSLFVDGELAVMTGARRLVRDDRWQDEHRAAVAHVVENLGSAGGLPLAESYPDEGWTFCHALAMVGLRMHEVLDGADHGEQIDAFLRVARRDLVEPDTGLLVSEFDMEGRVHDGPEGSSIWAVAIALRPLDPALAADQYRRAKQELGGSFLGWGYAREWPAGLQGPVDVDSGPLVPLLGASASSSGFAIAASRAFGDEAWHGQLTAALGAAEAVMAVHPLLARAADNPVGQAVVLWGLSFGPLWQRLER